MGAASGITAAYEFLFNAVHQLRKKGPSGWRQITFVTPEPYVGHLGVGGIGMSSELIERKLRGEQVEIVTNARVKEVEEDRIVFENGHTLGFSFAMLAPPTTGAAFVKGCDAISDERGFVRVDEQLRVPGHPEIFAAGAAAALPGADDANVDAPRTGYLAERTGKLVAENIHAWVLGQPMGVFDPKDEDMKLILDGGDGGFVLSARHTSEPRDNAWVLPGVEAHWAKVALEEFFLATRRRGVGI